MTEWILLGVAAVLIGLNALFVAVEFSFIAVDRATAERAAEAGDKRAGSLARALRTLSTQLSGAQLGITVTSLVVGYIAEPSIATLLRGPLGMTGLSETATTAVAVTLGLVLATFAQMIFGELVPKNWAIAEPLRVGRAVSAPQRLFVFVAGPLIRFLNGSANVVVRALGFDPQEELASARGAEELVSLVTRSGQRGTLDVATAELVARSIEFGRYTAADVMMPRPRVEFLTADQPVQDVIDTASATGHSRFPVSGEDIDEVVGFVHFKHALAVPTEERHRRQVGEVMVEPVAVADSMELDPVLRTLRQPGLQMAVVVDEYGGTAGIVTLEDLIEEIVGEIDDEQDKPTRRYRRSRDGSWQLSGLLRPDEVSEVIGLRLPEGEESDTLGGLLTERLGRLPQAGDVVVLEGLDSDAAADGEVPEPVDLRITVTRLDGHRVDRVRLRREQAAQGADDGATTGADRS